MSLSLLSPKEAFYRFVQRKRPYHNDYLAMYSTLLGGVVTDPSLMLIPIDDHMVHRGDGVFEVIKYRHGYIYQLQAHLDRLKTSAEAVEIKPPVDYREIKQIVKDTVRLTKTKDGIIHIYLSRGPGSFSVNPFESEGPQLYVVITKWKELPARYFQEGVRVIVSDIPVKPGFFVRIKSCNYLPTVLIKQQAIKAGADFAVNLDEEGNLAEGATESIGFVTKDGFLKFPEFKRILKGITLQRVAVLANELEKKQLIKGVKFEAFSLEEIYTAQEVFLFGTTIDVLPVTIFAGKKIGTGRPGPVFFALKELFETDVFSLEVSEPIANSQQTDVA